MAIIKLASYGYWILDGRAFRVRQGLRVLYKDINNQLGTLRNLPEVIVMKGNTSFFRKGNKISKSDAKTIRVRKLMNECLPRVSDKR